MYYIDYDEDKERYKLICRIQGEFYIYMTANPCSCHSKLKGFIFVGQDANLFMKVVLFRNPKCEETLIYKSLKKDGIYIVAENEEEKEEIEKKSNKMDLKKNKVKSNKQLLDILLNSDCEGNPLLGREDICVDDIKNLLNEMIIKVDEKIHEVSDSLHEMTGEIINFEKTINKKNLGKNKVISNKHLLDTKADDIVSVKKV